MISNCICAVYHKIIIKQHHQGPEKERKSFPPSRELPFRMEGVRQQQKHQQPSRRLPDRFFSAVFCLWIFFFFFFFSLPSKSSSGAAQHRSLSLPARRLLREWKAYETNHCLCVHHRVRSITQKAPEKCFSVGRKTRERVRERVCGWMEQQRKGEFMFMP